MELPKPELDELTRPYWDGLAEGVLRFQRCAACGHAWLPPRDACPRCLSAEAVWEAAGGGGRVVSWVVFHKAYHDAFADRVPYNVAIVELEEGPRLITNILGPNGRLRVGLPVRLRVERDVGLFLPRFEVSGGG
ncbi:Zn-ribbon domain-containing OB-fold protein [Muricoccus radiodurans]|uniref:Zn-ribbon domain-containing OB-fold protein n=1 Tax=Muricoccus radiodurans TaxID=2231721 RepID=UPI003CE879E9